MCIAAPGRVIERKDNAGRVDIRGNILEVDMGIVDAEAGDYVLVHAGCAIAKLREAEAAELDALFEEVKGFEG